MAEIKEGFASKPLSIRLGSIDGSNSIGVTVEQTGLDTGSELRIQRYETYSYATLEEIIALRDECNKVIAETVGL